jgi:putative transcriptional regulator
MDRCIVCGDIMPMKWRLPVLMADREMGYKELAAATQMHPGTVSKLKNNLPDRLEMETLMKLCKALECQPGDLLVYIPVAGEEL